MECYIRTTSLPIPPVGFPLFIPNYTDSGRRCEKPAQSQYTDTEWLRRVKRVWRPTQSTTTSHIQIETEERWETWSQRTRTETRAAMSSSQPESRCISSCFIGIHVYTVTQQTINTHALIMMMMLTTQCLSRF